MSTAVREILFGTAAATAIAFIGYLIYFDRRRQTDPEFRKMIRARRLKALENYRNAENSRKTAAMASSMNAAQLDLDDEEPLPRTPAEKEAYFVKQLHKGDELMQKGPAYFPAAAACLFRAVKVHPNPMQIMMMLQQAMPEQVFNMVMELMASELPDEPKITEVDD
ncbi:hypothetical protein HK098_007397 [Nowakowskiella sp. JEL0407]|nr:hypothetical protein HK098_007397 [Nowakowskiella sp. JEL0407]